MAETEVVIVEERDNVVKTKLKKKKKQAGLHSPVIPARIVSSRHVCFKVRVQGQLELHIKIFS